MPLPLQLSEGDEFNMELDETSRVTRRYRLTGPPVSAGFATGLVNLFGVSMDEDERPLAITVGDDLEIEVLS